jgi:hypothetical protein
LLAVAAAIPSRPRAQVGFGRAASVTPRSSYNREAAVSIKRLLFVAGALVVTGCVSGTGPAQICELDENYQYVCRTVPPPNEGPEPLPGEP